MKTEDVRMTEVTMGAACPICLQPDDSTERGYELGGESEVKGQFGHLGEGMDCTRLADLKLPKSADAVNQGMKYRQQPKRSYQGLPRGYRLYSDPNVEMVPLDMLEKYVEFDRDKTPSLREPGYMEQLKEEIKKNGINSAAFDEPFEMVYDPKTKKAILGDGNHRFLAAKEAGLKAVPVKSSTHAAWAMGNKGIPTPGHIAVLQEEFAPSRILFQATNNVQPRLTGDALVFTAEVHPNAWHGTNGRVALAQEV